MNQKAIEKIDVKIADIKVNLQKLVEEGLLEKMPNLIGRTRLTIVQTLFDIMDEIEDQNRLDDVPEEVAAFYNAIVEQYNIFDIKEEEKVVVKEKKAKKEKPVKEVKEKVAKEKPVKEVKEKVVKTVKEKKEKVVKEKTVKNDGGNIKRTGVGAWIVEGLKSGLFKDNTNNEIAEMAKEKFNSNTKATNISWYKGKIKKGLL